MLGKAAGGSEAALAGDGDAVHGKAVFEKRCTGCHAMDADREGPRLVGVFGRKAGSVPGFTYSGRTEEFEVDVERRDAGEVVERSGHGGAGQQHEL
jgi:cytochrome c2